MNWKRRLLYIFGCLIAGFLLAGLLRSIYVCYVYQTIRLKWLSLPLYKLLFLRPLFYEFKGIVVSIILALSFKRYNSWRIWVVCLLGLFSSVIGDALLYAGDSLAVSLAAS